MTPPPASSASSLVQEITALLAKLDEAPNRELAEEFKLHAPRLLRLLTAEYETLQREKDEWKQLYDETHARYDKAFARWEAAEARAEAAEGEVIRSVRDHWFIQGGEMQFGAIEGNNSDEVIASILSAVRSNIT